jgi:dTDP-4-dehydrorhamnose 3,5-epimerase
VEIRELAVPDSYVLDLVPHGDSRGRFTEWYRADVLGEAVGHPLPLAQANHSVSARGVLRGVHFALVPPGQAKYVYCPAGRVLDVVVDVRVGSPTFGVHDAVLLDSETPRAVYLAEGLGHAFVSLADASSVTYLVSTGYSPGRPRWSSAPPGMPNCGPDCGSVDRSPVVGRAQVSGPDASRSPDTVTRCEASFWRAGPGAGCSPSRRP